MKYKFSLIFFLLLLGFYFSYSQKRNKKEIEIKDDTQYIYFFDEATKNRLLENYETAINQYLEAIKLNPKSAVSRFYISSIYISKKEYTSALYFANEAVKLQPENFWYQIELADINYIIGNTKEAVKIYEGLLLKYPENTFVFERLINRLTEQNDLSSLIKYYELKEKSKGLDENEYTALFDLYKKAKAFDKAESALNFLIGKHPDHKAYGILLAEFYAYKGDRKAAEDEYLLLLNKFQADQDVLLSYAWFCRSTGQRDHYYITVKQLLITDLDFNTKVNLLISGQYPNFQGNQYLELLELLYSQHPNEFIANTLLAEYFIEIDQKEQAIIYIKHTISLNSYDFNLILVLFELLYDTEKFNELYEESSKIKLLFPTHAKVYFYQGIASYKMKNFESAIEILKEGLDYIIDDSVLLNQFYYYLAESYHEVGDNIKSDDYFERLISTSNNFFLAYNQYSYYLAERGIDTEKAERLARKCVDYDRENPVFSNTYALCLYTNEKYEEALIYSEKSLKIRPNNFLYLELHGNILFMLDKKEEALKYWNQSLQNGNIDKNLIYKIKMYQTLKKEELK